jgi:hypothetical protein
MRLVALVVVTVSTRSSEFGIDAPHVLDRRFRRVRESG